MGITPPPPRCTGNTADDLSPSYKHYPAKWTDRRHAFIDHIMEADIPLCWKPLNLEQYGGTTGTTLTWYGGLPPKSLDSFDPFVKQFSAQYATRRCHFMTSTALASLRQADDESLKKFMDRFGSMTIQIQNLNLEVALHSMLLALRPDKFIDSLCKKPLDSMDKLRERAKGYI
ncbi:hypothetical protein JHK85_012968 [Glycine max]|nr:hypothetical protein JHK85_012968 [Glycine max]